MRERCRTERRGRRSYGSHVSLSECLAPSHGRRSRSIRAIDRVVPPDVQAHLIEDTASCGASCGLSAASLGQTMDASIATFRQTSRPVIGRRPCGQGHENRSQPSSVSTGSARAHRTGRSVTAWSAASRRQQGQARHPRCAAARRSSSSSTCNGRPRAWKRVTKLRTLTCEPRSISRMAWRSGAMPASASFGCRHGGGGMDGTSCGFLRVPAID